MLPAAFFNGNFDLQKRWLACMRITFAPMVAMGLATVLHLPLCLLFVKGFGFDLRGLAIATSFKDFLCCASLEVYCQKSVNVREAL